MPLHLPLYPPDPADEQPEDHEPRRPRTRAECPDTRQAKCPWLSCRWHLGHDQKPDGSIRLLVDDIDEMSGPSCALDVADDGGATLQEIGDMFRWSREYVRVVEQAAMKKLAGKLRRLIGRRLR